MKYRTQVHLLCAAIIVISAGLTSCTTTVSAKAEGCKKNTSDFQTYATCTHNAVLSTTRVVQDLQIDLKNLYLAYLDAIAERVRSGQMTNTDAFVRDAETYSKLTEIALARNVRGSQAQASTDANSLSMMRMGLQLLSPPAQAPNNTTNCIRTSMGFTCQ